ncbi:gluconokinase, GntK/IdnK-type [Acinetobacter baumannii]
MGVCGTGGKTLIGELLSERLACEFLDGDTLHSAANKSKMSQGIPLMMKTACRGCKLFVRQLKQNKEMVKRLRFTCSFLKRMYRDILRGQDQNVKFVYLKGSYELLQQRLAERSGHFFDPALLQTQLDTLEVNLM